MYPNTCHAIGIHHNVGARKTLTVHARELLRLPGVRVVSMALIFIAWAAPIVRAEPYEVLVVDIAAADDAGKIAAFEKDAASFNALQHRGYSAARPYFNLLHMVDGRVYFVFGFRGNVQGVHRRDYPRTAKNLQRIQHKGVLKYPHIHWLPVEEIRRLLAAPK